MKRAFFRITAILLIIISALSLVSCGASDDEYTYDFLPSDYPLAVITYLEKVQAIKGGAYVLMGTNDLEGVEFNNITGREPMRCIFNEETKVLMPLCMDLTCEHGGDSLDCFGTIYMGYIGSLITGIHEDMVFCIRETPKVKNQIEVVYYSLDGTLQKTVEYAPELTMPGGEPVEKNFSFFGSYHVKQGSVLYLSICTPATENASFLEQGQIEYAHWILRYDLDEKKWDLVATVPNLLLKNNFEFDDAKNSKVEFECDGVGYVLDTDTGEIEVYDCAKILDSMIAEGKVPVGTKINDVYALRDYFLCKTEEGWLFCRISTQEIVDSTEVEGYTADHRWKFIYNGDLYMFDIGITLCTNINTGEEIPLETEGKCLIFFGETEKGIIFTWLERLEDGSLEPTSYHVKENGKDVTYFYPEKYLYVTKEDIMDGKIDEPWYYDAETYSFVKK